MEGVEVQHIMSQQQTAFVVVSKDWLDTGIRYCINHGRTSRSTSNTHILIGDVENTSDERGLWLKNIKTTEFSDGDSPATLTMKFMIPRSFVLGLGLVADEAGETKLGFCPEGARIWNEPPAGLG